MEGWIDRHLLYSPWKKKKNSAWKVLEFDYEGSVWTLLFVVICGFFVCLSVCFKKIYIIIFLNSYMHLSILSSLFENSSVSTTVAYVGWTVDHVSCFETQKKKKRNTHFFLCSPLLFLLLVFFCLFVFCYMTLIFSTWIKYYINLYLKKWSC